MQVPSFPVTITDGACQSFGQQREPHMSLTHLGLIGCGAIAHTLLGALCDSAGGAPQRIGVLARSGSGDRVRAALNAIAGLRHSTLSVVTDLNALMDDRPDVVVECAGQQALVQNGAAVLARGCDLIVASVGALADDRLLDDLRRTAKAGGAQMFIPSGAIGGIDALGAARLSGIDSVTYTGRKPALAWVGTPAEHLLNLDRLDTAQVFFEGTARDAARQYPRNANVAATLALAGIGMDATRVRLIADPAATANIHEFTVVSKAVEFTMRLTGRPSPDNPKTSLSTAYALARTVQHRTDAFVI